MKLVWSPETASKAYIDTVKLCENHQESGVAELVSAMAAGWNARLIVETWCSGGVAATSIGLAVAARHTGGRHVCIVPDEQSRSEYIAATDGLAEEVIVGDPEEAIDGVEGVDFMVVDCRRADFGRVLRTAKLSDRGAVLVCKNASSRAAPEGLSGGGACSTAAPGGWCGRFSCRWGRVWRLHTWRPVAAVGVR